MLIATPIKIKCVNDHPLDKPFNLWYNQDIREGKLSKTRKGLNMAMNRTALEKELRERYLIRLTELLVGIQEETLAVTSNEIAIPCLDANGDDSCVVIKISVPRGTRNGDGTYTPYDPYTEAENYKADLAEKAKKAKETEAKKQAKIASDRAKREAKAKTEKGN